MPKVFKKPYKKVYRKYKKSVTPNTLVSRISKLEKQQEIRFQDINFGNPVADTGTFVLLNALTLGDQNGNREGTKIDMKSIQLRITGVDTDTYQQFRAILFIDKQSNGAAPILSDILQTTSNVIHTMKTWNTRQRFRILWDKSWAADTTAPLGYSSMKLPLKYYKKLNVSTYYNAGNTGGIADINKNALQLLLLSDSNVVTHPAIQVYGRLVYTA